MAVSTQPHARTHTHTHAHTRTRTHHAERPYLELLAQVLAFIAQRIQFGWCVRVRGLVGGQQTLRTPLLDLKETAVAYRRRYACAAPGRGTRPWSG
jgi:hypothetical protein